MILLMVCVNIVVITTKELIPEIMSIMNITNYLHNEFKNRRDYYSARFAVTKDATYKRAL